MDNGQIPPVWPVGGTPYVGSDNGMPMMQSVSPVGSNGVSGAQPAASAAVIKKDHSGLIKTITIVILALVSATFIGLFIWMYVQYNDAKTDLDFKIDVAVAAAKDEQRVSDEKEYFDREKNPYLTFAGPVDYGQLTFKYPKTWNLYVAADAANGGNFEAYFNPGQVDMVSKDTINALRVSIVKDSFETVTAQYQKEVDKKNSELSVESIIIGDVEKGTEVTANKYSGTIPRTDLKGYIVVFKIRDKTVILQTDSMEFGGDFDNLLKTITFNA